MSSMNIISFIKKLAPSLSRSSLESDLAISIDTVNTVLSTYQSLSEAQKVTKFNSKKSVSLVNEFYTEFRKAKSSVKLDTRENFPADMLQLFGNVTLNAEVVKKELEDLSNEVIVTQALTAYKTNIIRAVGHFYFITRYALDLANYLYLSEMEHGKVDLPKDAKLNKKQETFIVDNIWLFARLIAVYGGEAKNFRESLEDLGEISIPKEQVEEAVAVYDNKKVDIFNNLPSGFIGSPIYTLGLIFAEWEANRYKHLKDKKKLLELRFLHLRMLKEQGVSDVNTEKEISHLQRRITDIDYSVAKIEASVE